MKILLNLGIDFGTSFTKVCYRNAGTGSSEIVDFSADTETGREWEDAFIPTVVSVHSAGNLVIGRPRKTREAMVTSEYIDIHHLKMRLAQLDLGEEMKGFCLDPLPGEMAAFSVEELAVIFLANVIFESKSWVSRHRPDLFKGTEIIWSANVGVPVKFYDTEAGDRFERVMSRAWMVAEIATGPIETFDAAKRYLRAAGTAGPAPVDIHSLPEIGAAVQSLVVSPSTQETIYLYFDVGAGTLDGVSFKFHRTTEGPKVEFYCGEIKPLGVDAVIGRNPGYSQEDLKNFNVQLVGDDVETGLGKEMNDIRKLVGPVVMKAQQLDSEWKNNARLSKWYARHKSDMDHFEPGRLGIFLGGGGGDFDFYQESVLSTHDKFQQKNAAIPPYQLAEIPYAEDFKHGQVPKEELHRFQIAYGLSISRGEWVDFNPPSDIDELPPPPVRPVQPSGHYED